jgi:hypothetical protein
MAENGLRGKVIGIGVALDGTGFGNDGKIWGRLNPTDSPSWIQGWVLPTFFQLLLSTVCYSVVILSMR